MRYMNFPKINSLVAFILNSFVSIFYFYLFYFSELNPLLKKIQVSTPPFYLFILIPALFAIGGLGYWLYLRDKEKKGEEAKFATLISIILLCPPVFIVPAMIKYVMIPIYNVIF